MTATEHADLQLFVDGAWHGARGRETGPVYNPATGAVIGEVPHVSSAELDAALAAAQRGFATWRSTDVDARAGVLRKAATLMRERSDTIAALLTKEQGKPLAEARGEVALSANLFDWYGEEARRAYGRVLVRPTGQRSLVLKQPVGPVVALSPWNFPVYLLAKKLAPALAAGCSVIAKPAEETPASTSALFRCIVDAGLPPDVAQLVFGAPDAVSRHLLASPIIRKASFTGSVPVGRQLMRLAADGIKRMTMELGGHAPVLVFADCNLDKTLDMVVAQKFFNAGQVCTSPTRFYVEEPIYEAFLRGFGERAAALPMGDGSEPANKVGPLANKRRPGAVAALVDDARAKGARALTGGERRESGYFFEPTLLADVPIDAEIMSTEPFGPVAVARPFRTIDEAIEQANRLPYGLAAFAFTENGRRANMLGDVIEAGMIGVNSFGLSAPDAPFGGIKDSGFGSEGGQEGYDSYCVTKAVHMA